MVGFTLLFLYSVVVYVRPIRTQIEYLVLIERIDLLQTNIQPFLSPATRLSRSFSGQNLEPAYILSFM